MSDSIRSQVNDKMELYVAYNFGDIVRMFDGKTKEAVHAFLKYYRDRGYFENPSRGMHMLVKPIPEDNRSKRGRPKGFKNKIQYVMPEINKSTDFYRASSLMNRNASCPE